MTGYSSYDWPSKAILARAYFARKGEPIHQGHAQVCEYCSKLQVLISYARPIGLQSLLRIGEAAEPVLNIFDIEFENDRLQNLAVVNFIIHHQNPAVDLSAVFPLFDLLILFS